MTKKNTPSGTDNGRPLSRLYDFFGRLSRNQNREWFMAHKDEYLAIRAEWTEGMERANALLAEYWPDLNAPGSVKTYRIYRDVRFSRNKTPYKTHISSDIRPPRFNGMHVGIYLQAGMPASGDGIDDSGIWGGIWCPDAAILRKIRRAIVDNDDEWLEIVNDPELLKVYGTSWSGDCLKTVPKGFDRDHPMLPYLRLKDIGKQTQLQRSVFDDSAWPEIVADRARPLIPMMQFLTYSIEEDV